MLAGLDGPCVPVRGGAETESEPASGLEDLARRLQRRRRTWETGESPRGRREETSEASRLGHNGLRWRAHPRTANIHGAWPNKGTNWRHLLTGVLAGSVSSPWLVVAARCRRGCRQEGPEQSCTGAPNIHRL
ncbi:hypothetical protein NDU88_006066 [Pleurodeles waltl]|uniref:Uncharacterized protein n=1 Tax=Pleurodeles waltl TaxID=8319 RepID=A0AAV7UJZ4_PLEWA|nr:hypothetical protein NDU88_006066 [Pleurodeles waltl]